MRLIIWLFIALLAAVMPVSAVPCSACDGIDVCGTDWCCKVDAPDTVCPQDFGDWSAPQCNAWGNKCKTCDYDCDVQPPFFVGNVIDPQSDVLTNAATYTDASVGSCSDSCLGLHSSAPYAVAYSPSPGGDCKDIPDGNFIDSGWKADAGLSIPTVDGQRYCVRLKCRDVGLFVNTSYSQGKIRVDRTPPDTFIDSSPPTLWINYTMVTVSFSCSEPGCTFTCSLNGDPEAGCSTPINIGPLTEQDYTFRVWATDPAGNKDATPAQASWRVDMTSPQVTFMVGNNQDENNTVINDSWGWGTFTNADSRSGMLSCQVNWGDTIETGFNPAITRKIHNYPDGIFTAAYQCWDKVGWASINATVRVNVTYVDAKSTIYLGSTGCGSMNDWTTGQVDATLIADPEATACQLSWDAKATWIDVDKADDCESYDYFGMDGLRTVYYRCKDASGMWENPEAEASITVDGTAPTTTIDAFADPTSNPDISLTGTAVDTPSEGKIATVQYILDSNPQDEADGDFDSTTEEFTIPHFSFLDGAHQLRFWAVDQAMNEESHQLLEFTVDTQPPTVSMTIPAPPIFNIGDLDGVATDGLTNIMMVEYELNSSPGFVQVIADGGFGHLTVPFKVHIDLADGSYLLTVRALDAAGNQKSENYVLTIGTGIPGPEIDGLTLGQFLNDPSEFINLPPLYAWWRVQDTAINCSIKWNASLDWYNTSVNPGDPDGPGWLSGHLSSFDDGFPLQPGNITVAMRCTDGFRYGNVKTKSIIYDNVDPWVSDFSGSFTSPTSISTWTVTGTLFDGPAGGKIAGGEYQIKLNGLPAGNGDVTLTDGNPDSGSEAFWFSLSLVADGDYEISVVAQDQAGREGPPTIKHLILDTKAPVLTNMKLPPDDSEVMNISGIAEDPDPSSLIDWVQVDIALNGTSYGASGFADPEDGAYDESQEAFSYIYTIPSDGVWNITVTAKDMAGNIGPVPPLEYQMKTTMVGAGANFTGYVFNQTSSVPLPGATVRVLGNGNYRYETFTAANGSYDVLVKRNQNYTVSASYPGFGPEVLYDVLSDNNHELNFTLFPENSLCQDDCTLGDGLCHAGCNYYNGCQFYNLQAAQACDLKRPGFRVKYDSMSDDLVKCCEGDPGPPPDPTQVVLNQTDIDRTVRVTRIVMYEGRPVRMVLDLVE